MKCPHCETGINFEVTGNQVYPDDDVETTRMGYEIASGHCPECKGLIVVLRRGGYIRDTGMDYDLKLILPKAHEEVIYPKTQSRKIDDEVPEKYRRSS